MKWLAENVYQWKIEPVGGSHATKTMSVVSIVDLPQIMAETSGLGEIM